MLDAIDPVTFWGATGAASLAIYIIWDKAAQARDLKVEVERAQERERNAHQALSDQTVATTNTLREMTTILNRNDQDHRVINESLQLIINKCERYAVSEP